MGKSAVQSFLEWVLANILDIFVIIVAGYIVLKFQLRPFTANNFQELATGFSELITGILAVLALMAVSGMWDRNRRLGRIENVSQDARNFAEEGRNITMECKGIAIENRNLMIQRLSGKARAEDFFLSSQRLPDKAFLAASTVYISGITLTRTTKDYMHILGKRLEEGACVRIIIVDPLIDSVLQQLSVRSVGDIPVDDWRNRLEATETTIELIAKIGLVANMIASTVSNTHPKSKGSLEVGYLPYIPSFGLTMVNPDEEAGMSLVELYHHRPVSPGISFEISAQTDSQWHHFFRDQFNILWNSCRTEKFPRNHN